MATRAAPREERAPLRVVQGRGGRRRSFLPAAVILVAAIFAVAGLQAYLAQEGIRAAKLERSLHAEEERFALLRGKLAKLSSPGRVEKAARELGLTHPSEPVYVPAPPEVEDAPSGGVRTAYGVKHLLEGAR